MGMNKQFRVSFDVTATLSNEQEAAMLAALVELSKDLTKLDPRLSRTIHLAASEGPEVAFTDVVRRGLREAIRELQGEMKTDEITIRFSPAEVRVKS